MNNLGTDKRAEERKTLILMSLFKTVNTSHPPSCSHHLISVLQHTTCRGDRNVTSLADRPARHRGPRSSLRLHHINSSTPSLLGLNHPAFRIAEAGLHPTHVHLFWSLQGVTSHLLKDLLFGVKSAAPLQHGEIVAGLGLEPERHTRIVFCHDLVDETLRLHRQALSARV